MNGTGRFWPALIVGMLGLNMAIVAVTYVAAKSGEGAMVTPGYDERALRWDEHKVALDRSRGLGWKCDVSVLTGAGTEGSVGLTLTDAGGMPIAARRVEVQCFHGSHPASAVTLTMTTDASGRASAPFRTEHAGRFFVRIRCAGAQSQPDFIDETEVCSTPTR